MSVVRDEPGKRRAANAKGLSAFGVTAKPNSVANYLRTVREGGSVVLFTIGYERRDIDDLMSRLRDAGVTVLADIREKPVSRKADFRAEALRAACADAGLTYQPWPSLGSTEGQRDALQDSGDIRAFHKRFRSYARRYLMPDIRRLSAEARHHTVALLCYERAHEDCHRSIVADLVADEIRAGVVAIL